MHNCSLVLLALCILVCDGRTATRNRLPAGSLGADTQPVIIPTDPARQEATRVPIAENGPPPGAQASVDAAELLKRVAHSMGRYARDVSEIPLTVESKVSKFDRSGKQKSSKSAFHSMQFVRRSYAEGVVKREMRFHKAVSRDEANGDSATSLLALAFENGRVNGSFQYELILHVISKRLEVKFINDSPCDGFDPSAVHDEHLWCGETHLFLDSTTLDPLSASFEAGGFPRTFGDIRYLSFRFAQEFQKVSMEGGGEPLLLPAKVVVTYESERGRTVIESKYSVERKSTPSGSGSSS